jgi:hypothetical protein
MVISVITETLYVKPDFVGLSRAAFAPVSWAIPGAFSRFAFPEKPPT